MLDAAIKTRGAALLQPGLALTLGRQRIDHVIAIFPFSDQPWYQLRWILKIGVNYHHGMTLSLVQAGGHGDFLAKVATQIDQCDTGISNIQGFQDGQGIVGLPSFT